MKRKKKSMSQLFVKLLIFHFLYFSRRFFGFLIISLTLFFSSSDFFLFLFQLVVTLSTVFYFLSLAFLLHSWPCLSLFSNSSSLSMYVLRVIFFSSLLFLFSYYIFYSLPFSWSIFLSLFFSLFPTIFSLSQKLSPSLFLVFSCF